MMIIEKFLHDIEMKDGGLGGGRVMTHMCMVVALSVATSMESMARSMI